MARRTASLQDRKVVMSCSLAFNQFLWLRDRADAVGVSQSELVREAVADYIARHQVESKTAGG